MVWREVRRSFIPSPGTPPTPPGAGRGFGPYNLWVDSDTTQSVGIDSFTMGLDQVTAATIEDRIAAADAAGLKLVLAMTGGNHEQYKTGGVFDPVKWKGFMDTYNVASIVAAVAAGVAAGVIKGASMVDEPPNPSWGGYFNSTAAGDDGKTRLDALATYARAIFPTLPLGAVARYDWLTSHTLSVVDFTVSQYWRPALMSVTAYRDAALAQAALAGTRQVFAINVLDGGFRITNCPTDGAGGGQTGGIGTHGDDPPGGDWTGNCRMTAQQVEDYGKVLLAGGRGLLLWRYDLAMFGMAAYQTAFANIATDAALLSDPTWLR